MRPSPPPPCARRLHHGSRPPPPPRLPVAAAPTAPAAASLGAACRLTSLHCRPATARRSCRPPAPSAARRRPRGCPSRWTPLLTAARPVLNSQHGPPPLPAPMRAGCSSALLPGPHAPSCLGLRGVLPASPRRARAAASPEKKPLGHCSTFPVQHSNILFSQFQHFVCTISTFNHKILNIFNKNVELIVPKC